LAEPVNYYEKIFNDNRVNLRTVTKRSADWFADLIQDMKKIGATPTRLMKSKYGLFRSGVAIGDMYFYFYSPKYRETLPFYDRFPLVFPFRALDGGFLGLNMHYLPYAARIQLLDNLTKLANTKSLTKWTRLELTYAAIQSVASQSLYEGAIKHYLYGQVRSKFLKIDATLWATAVMLPVERFTTYVGSTNKNKVWATLGF
jgi:hypothetical protein